MYHNSDVCLSVVYFRFISFHESYISKASPIHLFQAEAGGSPALIAKGFGSGQSGSEQFEMLVPDNKVRFQC